MHFLRNFQKNSNVALSKKKKDGVKMKFDDTFTVFKNIIFNTETFWGKILYK